MEISAEHGQHNLWEATCLASTPRWVRGIAGRIVFWQPGSSYTTRGVDGTVLYFGWTTCRNFEIETQQGQRWCWFGSWIVEVCPWLFTLWFVVALQRCFVQWRPASTMVNHPFHHVAEIGSCKDHKWFQTNCHSSTVLPSFCLHVTGADWAFDRSWSTRRAAWVSSQPSLGRTPGNCKFGCW